MRQKKGSQLTVFDDEDGDRFDALVDGRVDVLVDGLEPVDGVDDEPGVAMPDQVYSVCRRTLQIDRSWEASWA